MKCNRLVKVLTAPPKLSTCTWRKEEKGKVPLQAQEMVCAALEEAVRGFGEAVRLSSRRFGGKTQSLVTWMHEEVSSPHVQCSEHQNARTKSTHPRAWPRPHVNLKHAYRGGVAGGWSGAGRLGQRPTCRYGDGPPPPFSPLSYPTQRRGRKRTRTWDEDCSGIFFGGSVQFIYRSPTLSTPSNSRRPLCSRSVSLFPVPSHLQCVIPHVIPMHRATSTSFPPVSRNKPHPFVF